MLEFIRSSSDKVVFIGWGSMVLDSLKMTRSWPLLSPIHEYEPEEEFGKGKGGREEKKKSYLNVEQLNLLTAAFGLISVSRCIL